MSIGASSNRCCCGSPNRSRQASRPKPAAPAGRDRPSSPRKRGPITPVLIARTVIIDSRLRGNDRELSPRGVTLHAARIGGGAAARADAGRSRQAAFRPVRADLDLVAAPLELVDGL